MSPGGALVIGATCVIAAMDGGLSALLVASLVGCGTYVTARRGMNAIPQNIDSTQRKLLELRLQEAEQLTEDEQRIVRQDVAAQLAKLDAQTMGQLVGNKEVAGLAAVGAFACPPLGLILIGAMNHKRWCPGLTRWADIKPAAGFGTTPAFQEQLARLRSS